MTCSNLTEDICLKLKLFGGQPNTLTVFSRVEPGDIGFLINTQQDALLGVFEAKSKAGNWVPNAWKSGNYPVQIQVIPLTQLKRLPNQSKIWQNLEITTYRIGRCLTPKVSILIPAIVKTLLTDYFKLEPEIGKKTLIAQPRKLSPEQDQLIGIVKEIETSIRNIIHHVTNEIAGENWIDNCLKPKDREDIKKRWVEGTKIVTSHRIVDELNFSQYQSILQSHTFKEKFKEVLGKNFEIILPMIDAVREIRNCSDHGKWHLLDIPDSLKKTEFLQSLLKSIKFSPAS